MKHFLAYLNLPAFSNEQVPAFTNKVDVAVQNVMNQRKKFKKLTEPNELQRYSTICKERLILKLDILNAPTPTTVTSQDDLQSASNAEVVTPSDSPPFTIPNQDKETAWAQVLWQIQGELPSMQEKQCAMQKDKEQIVNDYGCQGNTVEAKGCEPDAERRENRINEHSSQQIQELAIAKKALSFAEKRKTSK